jgi:arylsulfatase
MNTNYRKNAPNIILISTDQQRFDSLGVNGNSQIKTPHIDALASAGVNFNNAFIQNTICVPSRACIQTGRYTHQHGVTYMDCVVDDTPGLPESEKTFMEYLQNAGYRTGATGKIHMYPEKGFDWDNLTGGKGCRWLESQGSLLGPGPLGPKYAAWLEEKRAGAYESIYHERRTQESYGKIALMDIPLSADEYVDSWIGEESINFIKESSGQEDPFFLWCGFCGPHSPFDPPEPYRTMYRPEDMPLPVESAGCPSWRENWDEEMMRKTIAYYWGMVSCIDDQVGRIVSKLKELDIYDNTLIIFVSDHGEMLGEKGTFGKALFYDTVLRVPLLVKPPVNTEYVSRATDQLTEVMNIAPTVLDYAGIDIPETMAAHSLRNIINGGDDNTEMIFSEYVGNDKVKVGKCVRTKQYKYIRYSNDGSEELYALEQDVHEQYNLAQAPEFALVKSNLQNALFDWLAMTEWRQRY